MTMKILVDSNEFLKSLKTDISCSKDYIYIQTLSFEGDSVGKLLSNFLLSSNSSDRRLVIDYYTKFVLSDKFLYAPNNLFNKKLRQEVIDTNQLVKLLNNNGVQLKFINPVGPFLVNFARRNHKKLVVIDDKIVYLGGINFSEHNFYWHDLMLRIENSDIASFLKEDFMATWNGQNLKISKSFGDIQLHIFDGYSNGVIFNEIYQLMETAKEKIIIETPYLTFPFYEKLREIKQQDVAITVIAPEMNNRRIMNGYTRWEAIRSGFDLRLYKGRMTHVKMMLIDDNFLIIGSSNFDYFCYHSQQEIMAIIKNKEVISNFEDRVIKEDLKNSVKFEGRINSMNGYNSALMLKSIGKLSVYLSNSW